ncbi:uncharacterized protein LOC143046944 isoform X2 [Mytilus galloprovincialis]|uniref:uncharacterized protein LOC143046944 isoform X2 n=1 Tax=Mytilus galloprovincialis TaxID=29158 RepID=UPI003F7C557B
MANLSTVVLIGLPLVSLYFQFAVSAAGTGIPLGGNCKTNVSCSTNISNSGCKDKICQCTAMFYRQNNKCVDKIGLGLACTTTKPCKDVNADCKGNCTCKQSFYKDTICKPRIQPNHKCGSITPKNASCIDHAYCNSTSFCVCDKGYKGASCSSAMTMAAVEISTIILCLMMVYFEVFK